MLTNDDIIKLKEWNNTSCAYESNLCIHNKLEFQAKQNPNEVALRFLSESLTYRELNEASNAFANLLITSGVKTESFVLVYLERSLEMMVSIFGVLKSGGVYTPVNSAFPTHRIADIIADSDPAVIVTTKELKNKLPQTQIPIIFVDDFLRNVQTYDISAPQANVKPENLAYAIFTSGSTGKPKGVLIEHHSVMNRIGWMQKEYPISKTDVLLQKTPITFDVSIWELFWWSFVGAKLILLPLNYEKDPEKLIDIINLNKITTIHFVPSMFNVFVNYLKSTNNKEYIKSIKRIFCSGEALLQNPVLDFYQISSEINSNTNVINLYGPTEATVDVTYYDCPKFEKENLPIGKPIDNTQIYIINENKEILPPNKSGELIICGVNLARGYLKREQLTNEKFIEINVFGEKKRAYKTGDLAYFNSNGDIIYQGRIDRQIKLRGFRIELDEIENNTLKIEGIKECSCILYNEGTDNACIVCFYVILNEHITSDHIKSFLKEKLPDYMVPSIFKNIESLPLSSNGKVNKDKLLEILNTVSENKKIAKSNTIEKQLIQIWETILNKKISNTTLNFFDIGGNSLLLMQMMINIQQVFSVKIEIIDLLENTTIKQLSNYIDSELKKNKI